MKLPRSVRNFIDEKMYGVTSLQDEVAILESIENDWTTFALRLKNIRKVRWFVLKDYDHAKFLCL
jgi:hypothetical protein